MPFSENNQQTVVRCDQTQSCYPNVDCFPITACPMVFNSFNTTAIWKQLQFLFYKMACHPFYPFTVTFNIVVRAQNNRLPLLLMFSFLHQSCFISVLKLKTKTPTKTPWFVVQNTILYSADFPVSENLLVQLYLRLLQSTDFRNSLKK